MNGNAGDHCQYEADGERGAGSMRRREAADRHHRREMIEPDDRRPSPDNKPSTKVTGIRPPMT